ncbi:MAG: tRNA (adenosine(37)-N6)-dimethylallyltransferase MiaA [Puniceicoccales bacterium]|jgi:tRNA dimethylallyltransferase|nr:tRNA (adenosine(37)-N6)-dimethylallyltransferase MiaA [Puniceicoccales bacterium]
MLYILAGPTASGKSDYALEFATQHACEILSCDASAFYKRMDIGTAKPSKIQQACVPHWGIDLVYPNEYFSIKHYLTYAQRCVSEIFSRNHNVLVVGGSGFYLKSFLTSVVDEHEDNPSVMRKINRWEEQMGVDFILKKLRALNPLGLPNSLDVCNLRKVKKALLRCLTTGLPLQMLHKNFEHRQTPFAHIPKHVIYILRPLELLKLRVRKRTKYMLQTGLIEEVRFLLENNYLLENTPAALTIGYRETVRFLTQTRQSKQDLCTLEEQIVHNTCQLIKKQNTWFRHQLHFDAYLYY